MTLRLEGTPPAIARVRDPAETIVVRLLGACRPAHARRGDRARRVGRVADPAHLRVEVAAGRRTPAAIIDAAASGVPLEVALLVNEERDDVRWLEPVLADVPVARVLVHLANGDTTPSTVVRAIRAQLEAVTGAARFVGGTASGFSELNREPPGRWGRRRDRVRDQPGGARHRRAIADGNPRDPGPGRRASARPRSGGSGGGLPVRMRAHAGTLFADAWTIGSLAALAGAEVASITCDTSARALATVAELHGRELAEVSVSHLIDWPRWQQRDASDLRGSITMIVANLTPSPQAFRLGEEAQPPLGPYEVRTLSGDAASSVVVAHRGHVLQHPQARGFGITGADRIQDPWCWSSSHWA